MYMSLKVFFIHVCLALVLAQAGNNTDLTEEMPFSPTHRPSSSNALPTHVPTFAPIIYTMSAEGQRLNTRLSASTFVCP